MRPASPPLRRFEIASLALASVAVAMAMHWPLPLHLGSDVSRDIGDPLVQAWQVAWGGHGLLHQPLDIFQANQFWPLENTLAFSDALLGYAPAGALGEGFEAAVVRYNLLFLFAYALALAGAYLLARELGVPPWGAAAAGAAFAYAPWRLEQDGHLHVLSSGGIALSLFLLVRGYRRGGPGSIVAGWLTATWQLTLGFTLGLQLVYLLAALGAASAVVALRHRWAPPRRVIAATALGVAAFALTAVLLARPYMEVLDDHPEARRTTSQVAGLSPPPEAFLAAPEENLLWGRATAGVRDELSSVPEQTLFPGLAIVALAIAGLAGPPLPRRLRFGLGLSVLACAVLSLGFKEDGLSLYPYRLLFEYLPGWEGIRVPGRLMTLTSLGLALLAGAGACRIATKVRPRLLAAAAPVLIVAAILVEGSGFDLGGDGLLSGPSHPSVPRPPAALASIPAPRLHLPATAPAPNRRYVLWSTGGFPKIVNGRASFDPLEFERVVARVRRFPDRDSAALLRAMGIRAVVVHPTLASLSSPEEAHLGLPRSDGGQSLARLGLTRSRRGELIVYELSSR